MIVVKNGMVIDVENKKIEKMDILIKDKKIEKIASNIEVNENIEIIDALNKYVVPGFIDAHTHLGLKGNAIGFEGIDHNEKNDPIVPQMRAIDGVNPLDITFKEALWAGITTVATGPGSTNVIGGQFAAIKTFGTRIDDMLIKEPLAMKCSFGENPKRNYNSKNKTPVTRMGIAALLRETLYKAKEYYNKKILSESNLEKAPAFDMKYEALIPLLKREIPIKAHVHRADDIFTAIRIAKEFNLKLTLDHVTSGVSIIDDLMKEDYPVILGPSLGHRGKSEVIDKSFKTAVEFSLRGKKIALTTDSPVVPLQYLPLCAILAVKEGMDRWEALRAISIYPAEIMEISDRVGSLKEGKDGDLVIWNGHPLDILSKVEQIILDGKLIQE